MSFEIKTKIIKTFLIKNKYVNILKVDSIKNLLMDIKIFKYFIYSIVRKLWSLLLLLL